MISARNGFRSASSGKTGTDVEALVASALGIEAALVPTLLETFASGSFSALSRDWSTKAPAPDSVVAQLCQALVGGLKNDSLVTHLPALATAMRTAKAASAAILQDLGTASQDTLRMIQASVYSAPAKDLKDASSEWFAAIRNEHKISDQLHPVVKYLI